MGATCELGDVWGRKDVNINFEITGILEGALKTRKIFAFLKSENFADF